MLLMFNLESKVAYSTMDCHLWFPDNWWSSWFHHVYSHHSHGLQTHLHPHPHDHHFPSSPHMDHLTPCLFLSLWTGQDQIGRHGFLEGKNWFIRGGNKVLCHVFSLQVFILNWLLLMTDRNKQQIKTLKWGNKYYVSDNFFIAIFQDISRMDNRRDFIYKYLYS